MLSNVVQDSYINNAFEKMWPMYNIIQLHGCVSILYLEYDMGLHYLTFMGRNLEYRKKLTPNMSNDSCRYE